MDGGAVAGALPGIHRVLGTASDCMLKLLEGVCDLSGNGGVAGPGLVFPL